MNEGICSMAVEECKSRFLSNTTFFYSYNMMITKMHKQSITVSVGLIL